MFVLTYFIFSLSTNLGMLRKTLYYSWNVAYVCVIITIERIFTADQICQGKIMLLFQYDGIPLLFLKMMTLWGCISMKCPYYISFLNKFDIFYIKQYNFKSLCSILGKLLFLFMYMLLKILILIIYYYGVFFII